MSILNKTELRLTLLNMAVFAAVLITFSGSIYFVFVDKLQQDTRSDLQRLADAAISSIDFDEDKTRNPDSATPDLIASAMPNSSASLLNSLKLQWFDRTGKLAAEKGTFVVNSPLDTNNKFEILTNPRGIIYTKTAFDNDTLLGYVRVAQPLDKQDRAISNLVMGLAIGTLTALFVSGLGMALLVRQSISPIQEAMKKLRQFTSDASHELRTPIMAIEANSGVALKYSEGMRASDKEKFQMIHESGQQMQRLVESLLTLNMAERRKFESSSANILTVARQAKCELDWLIEIKATNVSLDIAENLSVNISEDDLRRVISNLLENAINYTGDGGTVILRSNVVGSLIQLSVQDNGIGISEKDIEKVFDRFWRGDKTRSAKDGGQGLGLSISRALIEQRGGTINAKSELGIGSTFTISLSAAYHKQRVD